ncbi:hypothetical protein [Shinella zoogloeoides]|uniref:hypothetical protein n=1 Tax=Shinella zoogloeoides TaxID=352475 RepID=UPI0028A9BCA6|nr:hypothetical protein [Shinella zoogloeoides]
MERGFFHAELGYWQTTGDVPAEILSGYPEGTVEVPLKPGADYDWQDGAWAYVPPPEQPEPVPEEISRRQFYQALAKAGKITKEEALAAIQSGAIPAALQVLIDGMADAESAFDATMLLAGATTFYRSHPLVLVIAITQQMTEAEVDNLWRAGSAL